jgi:hypothetical protein
MDRAACHLPPGFSLGVPFPYKEGNASRFGEITMRMLNSMLLAAAAATLAACAGPADPSAPTPPNVYRTGSLVRQPDGPQPDMSYYTSSQLAQSPNQTLGGAIAHSVPTPVPPPQQQ